MPKRTNTWTIIILQIISSIVITLIFSKTVQYPYLMSYSMNPAAAMATYDITIKAFLNKFLIYILISTVVSAAFHFWFLKMVYDISIESKRSLVLFYILVAFLGGNVLIQAYSIKNYKVEGRIRIYAQNNYFLNKTMIYQAKDRSDYNFLRTLISRSEFSEEDTLAIIKKRNKKPEVLENKEVKEKTKQDNK